MKRFSDIIFSAAALAIFIIPIGIIIFIMRMVYHHPVIFYQERIGRDKKPFKILKFQTLVDDKPTGFGNILRKTGLDELPQFFNVFKGEMSIVGPRALTLHDIKRLNWDIPTYQSRWAIKPGITGYAQIYGGQGKRTSWFWDRKYIETGNLKNDIRVIFVSLMMNIFGKRRIRNAIWPDRELR